MEIDLIQVDAFAPTGCLVVSTQCTKDVQQAGE